MSAKCDHLKLVDNWIMDVNVAWAAGLFEGEGCISWQSRTSRSGRKAPRLMMGMTDEDVVLRFKDIIGCGRIYVQIKNRSKPLYMWQTTNRADFDSASELLEPWLGARRLEKLAEARRIADLPVDDRWEFRSQVCKHGHEWTPENTYIPPGTRYRLCRACGAESQRRIRLRKVS